jgi:hypothetical protein
MINENYNGGLKLQDLETKIKSLHIKWLLNIADPEYKATWKEYLGTKLQSKQDIEAIVEYNTQKNDYPIFVDSFYQDIFSTWASLHSRQPTTNEQVMRETIWNNSYIKVNFKTLYYTEWIRKGILFIQDLVDDTGQIMSKQNLEHQLQDQIKPLRYESLISAIPNEWKKLLKHNQNLNNNYLVFRDTSIIVNNIKRRITDLKAREIYWLLLKPIMERPTSENKWREKTNLDLNNEEWATIYTLNNDVTRDTTILNLQFKITHRILACGKNLKTWKINVNDICKTCNKHVDTIEHFMIHCEDTPTFSNHILNW